MAKAKYYVLARTLWAGDTFSPIAGPFVSKQEAQKVADEKAHDGWSEATWSEKHQAWWSPVQNLTHVVHTIVVSKTEMKRKYRWSEDNATEEIYCIEMHEAERKLLLEEYAWDMDSY